MQKTYFLAGISLVLGACYFVHQDKFEEKVHSWIRILHRGQPGKLLTHTARVATVQLCGAGGGALRRTEHVGR